MISSGTKISEIEEYMKGHIVELHERLEADGVPHSVVSGTDSLSLALVDFFLNSVNTDKLATLQGVEIEVLKRSLSISVAQCVIFACEKIT